MAKERPVPSGTRKPANTRDRQAAPARPQTAPATPAPRRPPSGGPSDPRPIAAPFMQHPAPATGTQAHPATSPEDLVAQETRHAADTALATDAVGTTSAADAAGPECGIATGVDAGSGGDVADAADVAGAFRAGDAMGTRAVVAAGADVAIDPAWAKAAKAAGGAGASAPTTRTHGRPLPGPQRTSPTHNPIMSSAHPYRPGPAAPATATTGPGLTAAADPDPRAAVPPVPLPAAQSGRERNPGTEPIGIAKVRPPRPALPGLQLQPMVHVDDMTEAVAFYERLGGEVNHGDRDGDWVLMQVGTSQVGLVTRPPNATRGESTVELNFSATMPLDRLEQLLRDQGVTIVRVAIDPDLGTQLHVETPDGMPIKIHQVEPDLMV